MFTKKYLPSYLIISFFFILIIYFFIGNYQRNKYLYDKNTLFTIGIISDIKFGGKVSTDFVYKFIYVNETFDCRISSQKLSEQNNNLKSYIGKKYFVKFSTEKPEYSEIYLDKPVPKDFVYKEGQTWSKIPVDYE